MATNMRKPFKAGDHLLFESYGAERPGVITRTTRNGIVFIACLGADGQQTERWAHVHSLRHDDAPGSADNRPDVAKS